MAAVVYCNIFELLIVTIFHGFSSSIMLAMRWGIHVSILKIIAHSLGCRESIV
jgi:hypothetical protein